jgi:hypothetical protein
MSEKSYSQKWNEIQKELEELCKLHDETMTSSGKCREFNGRAAIFLQKLEDTGCDRIADMFMDLLGSCSPKDFSHCDNHERTKGTLNRIRSRVNQSIEKRQE